MDALPDEIIALVFRALPCVVVRGRASAVCWRWRRIALDETAVGRRLCAKKCAWRRREALCADAAQNGHLDCLVYAHRSGRIWDDDVTHAAALGGSLECLRYARDNGCPWDATTTVAAASGGHLDCLRYLHENGCRWDERTCSAAAADGHLDCLDYAHANGCRWGLATGNSAALGGHLACMAFAAEHGRLGPDACAYAARSGSVECLAWAHERGFEWDRQTCTDAARSASLECLIYAHQGGCPWDGGVFLAAISGGSLDCVRYLWEQGCPRDDAGCLLGAVTHGDLAILAFLIDRGLPWTLEAVKAAACRDHVDVLERAHADGFIDKTGDVCHEAAERGRAAALAFAHGCGWAWGGRRTCEVALGHRADDIDQYVKTHGCRCSAWERRFAPARRRRLVVRNVSKRTK